MNTSMINPGSLAPKPAGPNRQEPMGKGTEALRPESRAGTETQRSDRARNSVSIDTQGDDLKNVLSKEKKDRQSSDVNEYLKVISRLENKVKKDEMKKEDTDKVIQSLDERIQNLKESQKKRLLKIEFFEKQQITDLKTFRQKVTDLFADPLKRDTVFDFLKNPEFMAILLDQPEIATTYSPAGVGNMVSTSPPPSLKGPSVGPTI